MDRQEAQLSFDLKTADDLFTAFSETVDEYLRKPLSARRAVVCAMLGWHIVEWLFTEAAARGLTPDLRQLRDKVIAECPALARIRDVADGTKHVRLSRKTAIQKAEHHQGAFSAGFSRGFDVSALQLIVEDGSLYYFDDDLKIARQYWRALLRTYPAARTDDRAD